MVLNVKTPLTDKIINKFKPGMETHLAKIQENNTPLGANILGGLSFLPMVAVITPVYFAEVIINHTAVLFEKG